MFYTSHSKYVRKKILYTSPHLQILFACGKIVNLLQESLSVCVCMRICVCIFVCMKTVLFPLSELGAVFTEFLTGKCLN